DADFAGDKRPDGGGGARGVAVRRRRAVPRSDALDDVDHAAVRTDLPRAARRPRRVAARLAGGAGHGWVVRHRQVAVWALFGAQFAGIELRRGWVAGDRHSVGLLLVPHS